MRVHRPAVVGRVALAAVVACTVLLASCAAPSSQATPPSTTSSPTSPSKSESMGPLVTAPGLSTSAASSEAAPPTSAESAEPSTSEPEPAPEPAPEPEPEITAEPAQSEDPGAEEPDSAPEPEPEPAPAPALAPVPAAPVSGGRVVVIDPGHNGANGAHPDIINALVPAGFGQTKPCNTTGTSTNAGYDEHAFTWNVANDLKPILEASGIEVIMTRSSDDGVGPCVDQRAAIGNSANADAVISIHGDGDDASARGYYVMTAQQDPAGPEMAARSQALAVSVRDGLTSEGLSPSNHLGDGGLWPRGDLAGLNLSVRPTVMVEAGNMRNSADADLMSSASGQQQVAQGLANGVLAFLGAGGAG